MLLRSADCVEALCVVSGVVPGVVPGVLSGAALVVVPDGAAVSASTLSVELSMDVERDVRVIHVLEVVSKSFVLKLILNT